MSQNNRTETLAKAIGERVLVLDGAMGTNIQDLSLTPQDFGGIDYEGCNEFLNVTRPEIIREIHNKFLEAGADIIQIFETWASIAKGKDLIEFSVKPIKRICRLIKKKCPSWIKSRCVSCSKFENF